MDEQFMRRALTLAENGRGRTNPNPLVGCVIVRDGTVLAEGYHAALGEDHAERAALRQARKLHVDVRGAVMYVSLEPCSHHGRTPPCADAVIEAGIREVVVAMTDPNPVVAGNGIRKMREAGILVRTGVLEDDARQQNEPFIKYIVQRLPFVVLKTAMSLDGKIATASGCSQWISCEESRESTHELRDRYAAIMAGSGTILQDDPRLNTRLAHGEGRDPIRIVIDSSGRIPMESKVFISPSKTGVLLATTSRIAQETAAKYESIGVEVLRLDGQGGKVDLLALMRELGAREIDSVLLEGGSGLNAAALKAGIVDKVLFFIAPLIVGGIAAPSPVGGNGINLLGEAVRLERVAWRASGQDMLVEGYPVYPA